MIQGYGWLLSAVIAAAWALSWWGRRRIRWSVLCAAAVVSVSCAGYGFGSYGKPMSDAELHCAPTIACLNLYPVGWMNNGLVGLGCCFVLLIVTSIVELVAQITPRASAE